MITSSAQIITGSASGGGGGGSTPRLDQVLNPTADKTFDLGGNSLIFQASSGTSGIALVAAGGSGGIALTDLAAAGITLMSTGAVGINSEAGMSILNSVADGISIHNTSTGGGSKGIDITNEDTVGFGTTITDTGAGGIALSSVAGIALLNNAPAGNTIEIDTQGTGSYLDLNPAGFPVVINGGVTPATPPATDTSTGVRGTILWATVSGTSYIYVCIATNTWRRVALATF